MPRRKSTPEQHNDYKKRKHESRKSKRDNMSPEEKAATNEQRRRQYQEMDDERRGKVLGARQDYYQGKRRRLNLSTSEEEEHTTIDNSVIISDFNEVDVEIHSCGELNVECEFCGALHFAKELPPDKRFSQCCHKGKVALKNIKVSELIKDLMTNNHLHSKNFKENVRSLNSALAFASLGANLAPPPGHGPYCFRISGQIYHRAGTLHPINGDQRKFAQLYILDPDEAAMQRMEIVHNSECDPALMKLLSEFMSSNNPFAEACKMMYEVEQESILAAQISGAKPTNVVMSIVQNRNSDPRRYNPQRTNEVAVIFENEEGEPPLERDLLIHCKSNDGLNKTERISVLDPNLEAMVYPLLFPYGDQSWSTTLKLNYTPITLKNLTLPQSHNPRNRITQMQYYAYRLSIRNDFNQFISAGKLTLQYFVDAYVKMEANRLNYVRQNQSNLRVDKYTGLMDFIQESATEQGVLPGKPLILPSSFVGSPRNLAQNYQDGMAIVRKYGKPDYFVTMTCNPKWSEITQNLNGQSSEFRPDLIARVFKLKLNELLKDIKKKHVLGVPVAHVHVIEFQKRGLPHAHILVIMKAEDKPKSIKIIDSLISAEIPDPKKFPRLYSTVTSHMIHGPCGKYNLSSPCMVNGTCSKRFPKTLQNETTLDSSGYPNYKRNPNTSVQLKGKMIDNSWVVPYNRTFCLKYDCHINIECCTSIQSVKYLFKYIYKGHDCANVKINEKGILSTDEIKTFIDSRYVSAPEAAWRIFGFEMHQQSHSIIRLQVHLPGEQLVYFDEENLHLVAEKGLDKDTTLTAWFKLNQCDESARSLFYIDVPSHYVFDKRTRSWVKRQQRADSTIGRIFTVNLATDPERFCLRLLLLHTPGATSFADILTVNNITYPTFKIAAQERGLFLNEMIWEATLMEASAVKMPKQLRELFAYLCIESVPFNIQELFEKFKSDMWEDYARHTSHNEICERCESLILYDIENILKLHRKSLQSVGLPTPTQRFEEITEDMYDIIFEKNRADHFLSTLSKEQKDVFDEIVNADLANDGLHQTNGNCFFLDGPGGSGKTYLYEALLSYFRSKSKIALAVASTGIAANLLANGRTAHSQFGLTVPVFENSVSHITEVSAAAKVLKSARLIIWDESTMALSHSLKCIDDLLKRIMQNEKPFGGKVFLLGGDFRQTLPIVRHGSRVDIVEASIKKSKLWKNFKILHLTSNVRSTDLTFSEWLIKVGSATLPIEENLTEDTIEIPEGMICNGSLVSDIFGSHINSENIGNLTQRAILSPLNTDVDKMNEEVLSIIDGEVTTYLSIDSIVDEDLNDRINYPTEFLNDLAPSGLPLHKLNLKVNSIIMLLRNLNTKLGLCNGTRLIVKGLKPNLIIAEVLTGSAKNQTVFIPRIDLAPKDTDLPFVLRRRQFPIKLAFAMTINKSQGQTFDKVGIYLPEPVFSHGQLYVALSRVRSFENVKLVILDGPEQGRLIKDSNKIFTKNVVFKEIFSM